MTISQFRLNNQPDFSQLGILRCQLEVQDSGSISECLDFHGPRIVLAEHAKDSCILSINELCFDHNIEVSFALNEGCPASVELES